MQSPVQVQQILEKYFSEYESYHLYTLLSVMLAVAIFQIIQAIYVSKKIEKFKNELKRSEIRFSRFQNMQIDALKGIYDKTVSFHYANHRILNLKYFTHTALKIKIREWENAADNLLDIFHHERILTPKNIVEEIKLLETMLKEISDRLHREFKSLEEIEDHFQTSDVQVIYGTAEEEISSIKSRMTNLANDTNIKNSELSVQKFRKSIEVYFEKLVL